MSALADDWRADLDDVDAALVDEYQSGFPVEPRPFRAVGAALGVSEREALARVERLRERGIFRRFGAVLNPPVIGSSTLAAVRAPEARFEEIAEIVNGYRQVNHNYRRNHAWNMWFVVTAGSRTTRDRILSDIEERTGCSVLNLPMLTDYYIDLEFPVVNEDCFARESGAARASESAGGARRGRDPAGARAPHDSDRRSPATPAGEPTTTDRTVSARDGGEPSAPRTAGAEPTVDATRISEEATVDLSALDRRLLVAIQGGLPLSPTPYADVAAAIDATVDEVVAAIERLLEAGCIKRVGCVVNHVVTGFDANCMVVWDVPDEELDAYGEAVGSLPYVTLCYHRPRRPDQGWPYNLFTMIHGRDPDAVDAKIDELAADYLPVAHERLYSTETLKQTGAQYEELVEE